MPDFDLIPEARDCLVHADDFRQVGLVPVGRCPRCISLSESLPRLPAKTEEDFHYGSFGPPARGSKVVREFLAPSRPHGFVSPYPWSRR